ncbi:nuclear transport factor 2 family protein [Mycetocola zhadangensis]|jgi:hypothetical protein|uniref:nuclear transport factor 2 family protein n=1 Tax=Mycetocola zhadangensis TaxID=1164595 RepID=UPI003A4DA13A
MSNTLPEPVARLIAAANAGDTEAFLATFAADGSVNDWGRTFTGHDAIRAWSDSEFIGVGVTLEVTAEITTREHTTITATVGGQGFNGQSHFSFTVSDGLVADMAITA